jgi:hypothetical protein
MKVNEFFQAPFEFVTFDSLHATGAVFAITLEFPEGKEVVG